MSIILVFHYKYRELVLNRLIYLNDTMTGIDLQRNLQRNLQIICLNNMLLAIRIPGKNKALDYHADLKICRIPFIIKNFII